MGAPVALGGSPQGQRRGHRLPMARERYQGPTTKLGEALRLRGGLDRFNAMSGPARRVPPIENAFARASRSAP